MDTEELMIGNIVDRPNFGEYVIKAIGANEVRTDKGSLPKIAIKGMPLTDTWLERCGAEKKSDEYNYEKEFMLPNEFYIREDKNSGIYYYDDTPLEFVHQLQNVYFILKRKKLVFKNK